jgi:Cu-processing system permease protein
MRRTRPVSVIAFNTFREIIRDRILYGIVVFALLLIGVSVVLGELSFAEQARISADFGFTGIQISACVLAIFVGSTLVAREIEKQTVLTLLAKPVTRSQFILGKFLGLALVVTAIMLGLAVVLALLLIFLGFTLELSFPIALLGILMEALFLISLALFFGTFARPMMTVVFAVSFFLIGHWVDSLDFFV